MNKNSNKRSAREEYALRIAKFEELYSYLLIAVGAALALGIAIAVERELFVGIAIVFVAVSVYVYIVNDEMRKTLGVGYRNTGKGICIKFARARYGEEFFVPKKLIMLDVVELEDYCFKSEVNKSLRIVHLPKNLERIGEDIFEGCSSLEEIHFEGDEKAFAEISSKTDLSGYRIEFSVAYPRVKKKKPPTKTEGKSEIKKKD